MDRFVGSSKNSSHPAPNQLFPYPHPRQRPHELDRTAKRRRSTSPLNEKFAKCKKTTLFHHQTQLVPAKIRREEQSILNESHRPMTTISAAVESINECANRLGLENTYLQDIEMDSCSESGDQEDNAEETTSYERVPVQSTNTLTSYSSILPLHKPHPIAYQQHLALISSNRSKKALKCINHLNHPPKKSYEDNKKIKKERVL